MFALSAWPTGGFAEMVVAVFATQDEAEADRKIRAARYPRWTFRVTEAREA
jgi:hypothetical protein